MGGMRDDVRFLSTSNSKIEPQQPFRNHATVKKKQKNMEIWQKKKREVILKI